MIPHAGFAQKQIADKEVALINRAVIGRKSGTDNGDLIAQKI